MRVNVVPDLSPVLAAMCRMYGKRNEGGFEVYIPASVIATLTTTGEIDRLPEDPAEPGWRFRYRPNLTIDGVVISKEVIEPEVVNSPPILPETK